jgi:hypothetical protein
MKGKIKSHHVLAFLMLAFFLSFTLFTACEKEVEKIVEVPVEVHDTITVTDTVILEIIIVDTINASPNNITQGQTVQMTVTTTLDPAAGTNLTYAWSADEGTIDHADSDTINWKAPDSDGAYAIRVTVSDGVYAGTGERMMGVGMYAPTATPYFVGDVLNGCACHQTDKVDPWALTAHAHAWESLQGSGHPASYCEPCHTTQDTVPVPGNSGYDDAPIAIFHDVQCESCHGPASEHAPPSYPTDIDKYDMNTCGKCHDGTHHPYKTEWLMSPHNFDPLTSSHGAAVNPTCEGCHEGVAGAIRLSGDLSVFYGSGSVGRPDTSEVPARGVVCATCHDPHSADNPGQMRAVDDVPLVTANNESPIISDGGVGKLCMHCHHARRGPESQIANGYAHFGPHANPQADMMAGKSAYHGVAPGFSWATPSHLLVQNSCKTCHLPTAEYGAGPGGAASTGHEFLPKVEACEPCHGVILTFRDIPASGDFDGNGTIEGLQDEVEGLLHLLEEALVADGLDTTGVGTMGALGDTLRSTVLQREAGYNLAYVEDDKSLGVHNPDYAVQLLQQSYLHLTGTLPTNATIVKQDNMVVRNW